jgi:hypothetical protein
MNVGRIETPRGVVAHEDIRGIRTRLLSDAVEQCMSAKKVVLDRYVEASPSELALRYRDDVLGQISEGIPDPLLFANSLEQAIRGMQNPEERLALADQIEGSDWFPLAPVDLKSLVSELAAGRNDVGALSLATSLILQNVQDAMRASGGSEPVVENYAFFSGRSRIGLHGR